MAAFYTSQGMQPPKRALCSVRLVEQHPVPSDVNEHVFDPESVDRGRAVADYAQHM